MEFRYMGFDQRDNARAYRFDGVEKGGPTRQYVVTADMGLFLAHRVSIQEGPMLCANKLAADMKINAEGVHELTGEDLRAHATAKALAEARKAESRKSATRHSGPPAAHRDSQWGNWRP
jgi:hypothetical protein